MYEDVQKTKKVYVESKCVSRDDCCWDETHEPVIENKSENQEQN